MTYVIDLTDVNTIEGFYEALADGMELPEYFGNNLDALYDVLTEIGEEIDIVFKNGEGFMDANEEYANNLNQMLDDATIQNENLSITFEEIEEYSLEELEAMGIGEFDDMDDTDGLDDLEKLQ